MPDIINNAKATVLLYKMQIAWFVLFTVGALCSAAMTGLTGMNWTAADPQTKVMVCISALATWINTMMALFNKSMARVRDGELPFVDGEQVTTRKTAVASVETTVSKSP